MNDQLRILRKFIDDRKAYELYAPYLIALKNSDRDFKLSLQVITEYYNKYTQVSSTTIDDLMTFLNQSQILLPDNTRKFITDLKQVNVKNEDLTLDVIEATVEKHIASRILDKVALVIDNNKAGVITTIQDEIDEFTRIVRNPPRNLIECLDFDLGKCIQAELKTRGLPFCCNTMNDEIKGARGGTNGLIFAYVDTGKTSFGLSNIVHMAKWIEINRPSETRPLIYAGNEEGIEGVALRATQSIMNYNAEEMVLNEKQAQAAIKTNGFQRIKWIDHVTHINHVERILDKYAPLVLYIDQGTKVKTSYQKQGTKDVNILEDIFNTYRDLGKQHDCAIIALAQADSDCDDKQWLTLRNVYGSKVAIQGELDWATGIGVNLEDVRYLNFRYVNICKNKKGDKKGFTCRFDPQRCQFKEVS